MPWNRGREILKMKNVAVLFSMIFLVGVVAQFPIDRPFKSITRIQKKLAFVLSGGYAVNKTGGSDTVVTGKGPVGGLAFQLYLLQNVGIELGAGYFRRNTEEISGTISKGALQSLPIQANLLIRFFLMRRVGICLFGGYHYMMNDFTIDGEVRNLWENLGFSIDEKVDHKGGFQAGLCLDFHLSRSMALGFEGRYFMTEGSGTFSHTEQKTGLSINGSLNGFRLDFMAFSMNIKFFLK